jgi:hypothetical protein
MIFILLILLLALTFIVRAYPRFVLPKAIASDTYFHLYLANLIRQNRGICPKRDSRFLLNGECNYPFFYHTILAMFGKKGLFFAERFSSAFFDVINNLILFTIGYYYYISVGVPEICALLPVLTYSVLPVLIKTGDEPRVQNGSSRVLAQTLYLLHMCGIFMYTLNPEIHFLILSVITASFIFFTTVFGIQVLLFFGIIISIFFPWYPLIIVSAFAVSLVSTLGRSWSILKTNFMHSVFLFKSKLYFQKLSPKTDVLNYLRFVKKLFILLFTGKFKSFLHELYFNQTPIHFLISSFHFFIVVFFFFEFEKNSMLLLWLICSIILFLLTKIPHIRFLGKAERYFEFGFAPALILSFSLLYQFNNLWPLYLIYLTWCITGIWFYNREFITNQKMNDTEFEETEKALKNFNDNYEQGTIWTVHPFLYKYMFFTKFPILGYFAGTINKKISSEAEIADMTGNYPYPSFHLKDVIETYQIKYIVTNPQYFKNYLTTGNIDLKLIPEMILEIENPSVVVYKIKRTI